MAQKINDLRDRMIVALDVPTIWDAYRIVSTLGDEASFYGSPSPAGSTSPVSSSARARRSFSTSNCTISATPSPRASNR